MYQGRASDAGSCRVVMGWWFVVGEWWPQWPLVRLRYLAWHAMIDSERASGGIGNAGDAWQS